MRFRSSFTSSLLLLGALHTAQAAQPSFIGILSAMPIEGTPILQKIQHKKVFHMNGITYTTGLINNKPVVEAITGMGKVNAAAVTTAMILQFHPTTIIFSGIAGGLNPKLAKGAVVVGKEVYAAEHNSLLKANDHNPNDLDPITQQVTPFYFPANAQLLTMAQKISAPKNFQLIFGTIATSDNLPDSADEMADLIKKRFDAIEMEGAAVMQVSWLFNTPCLMVRGISDLVSYKKAAQEDKTNTYALEMTAEQNAANHAAAITLKIINKIS